MGVPAFLIRKLYKQGSLRETADGRFAFALRNPLGSATLVAPPRFTINGVRYDPDDIKADDINLRSISEDRPYVFAKGEEIEIVLPGRLLRGANRIHMVAQTREYGEIDLFVEDREADYCDLPASEEE